MTKEVEILEKRIDEINELCGYKWGIKATAIAGRWRYEVKNDYAETLFESDDALVVAAYLDGIDRGVRIGITLCQLARM